MTSESRHISARIDRPMDEVYAYAVDPANLPEWAPGLGNAVENVDGRWHVETPMGRVGFAFVERNAYGVLDHEVTLPSLKTSEVPELIGPARMAPRDSGSCVVFTLEVDDVYQMCGDPASRGIELLNGPMDRPWGIRTASVRDPDGYIWEIAREIDTEAGER